MKPINLGLTRKQAEALRYAIAAWFSQSEGETLSKADQRRSRNLEDIQNEILRQERLAEPTLAQKIEEEFA